MRINLRKAAAVQQAIQDEVKRINVDHETRVSFFDGGAKFTLAAHFERFAAEQSRRERLLVALYTLRQIVARKNAEAGITDRLAEEAHLAALESSLAAISRCEPQPDLELLGRELQARREGKEESYGGRNYHMMVSALPADYIKNTEAHLANIRRTRRRIRDEMVSVNVKTEVEVPSEVSTVLVELGLD